MTLPAWLTPLSASIAVVALIEGVLKQNATVVFVAGQRTDVSGDPEPRERD